MSELTPALRLAHIIDPKAFEFHEIEERREVAAIQWAARRHIAHEHAVRVLESDWLAARDAAIRADIAAEVLAVADEIDWYLAHVNQPGGRIIHDVEAEYEDKARADKFRTVTPERGRNYDSLVFASALIRAALSTAKEATT